MEVALIPAIETTKEAELVQTTLTRFFPTQTLKDVAGQARLICVACGQSTLDMMFGRANKMMFCKFYCHSCRTQCVAHEQDRAVNGSVQDAGEKAINRSMFVRKVYHAWELKKQSESEGVQVWSE